jgi:Sigma-70 region 2
MSAGTIAISRTRITLLERVRNLGDGRSWAEFHAIYRPLISGYLRGLGLKEHDADDLTQEVFRRLMAILPKPAKGVRSLLKGSEPNDIKGAQLLNRQWVAIS